MNRISKSVGMKLHLRLGKLTLVNMLVMANHIESIGSLILGNTDMSRYQMCKFMR